MKTTKRFFNKEVVRFFIAALFGVFCGSDVFNISLDHITLGQFLALICTALVFGVTWKDVGKNVQVKH